MTSIFGTNLETRQQELAQAGYCLLRGVYSRADTEFIRGQLAEVMTDTGAEGPVRQKAGAIYAARNVLDIAPLARDVWRRSPLMEFITQVLGERAGLIRGLYFDKPPARTWALPWHKDLSVAVQPDPPASPLFSPARLKAGVPHCEAPLAVLESMLTLRIHLDPVTVLNGPLEVLPESHRTGKVMEFGSREPVKVLAEAGDVLAMRPLLAHCSGLSEPGTSAHRRILHLEFAAVPELPDGHAWYQFFPVKNPPL